MLQLVICPRCGNAFEKKDLEAHIGAHLAEQSQDQKRQQALSSSKDAGA